MANVGLVENSGATLSVVTCIVMADLLAEPARVKPVFGYHSPAFARQS
jgi:hypothetical protein